MKTTHRYFISTGQKQVLHTLWRESKVPRVLKPEEQPYYTFHYQYLRNLPVDKNDAIKRAKEWIKFNHPDAEFSGIEDSPFFKKAQFLDMYSMHFQERRKNGKSFFIAKEPSPEFWDEWRKNKEEMKKAGFRVSLFNNHIKNREEWYVFYRPEGDE